MASFGDLWERYGTFTSKASDTVRNSAIAGLAGVWLFSDTDDDGLSALSAAPSWLLVAGALFAACLAADILHYYVAARTVLTFTEAQEAVHGGPDPEVEIDLPRGWMQIPTLLYNAKVFLLFAGYLCMTGVLLKYAVCPC